MPTIVWDVDDVLNDLARRWLEDAWLPGRPGCPVRYEALTENPPHRLLGVDAATYLESLDEYRLSAAAGELAPVPEVLAWFGKHGDSCRHLALTARPAQTVAPAASWVFRHFGRWIRTFHFVPSPRPGQDLPGWERDKEDALRWLGLGEIVVDDSPVNLEGARRLGLAAVKIPRPWNASPSTLAQALEELTLHVRRLAAVSPGGPDGDEDEAGLVL